MTTDEAKEKLGIQEYRKGQKECLDKIEKKKHCLMVFPTAFGKSILYLIPGLTREGITIVVCPVISLINDQVEKLKKLNIPAVKLDGSVKPHLRKDFFKNLSNYKFLFLTPEQLMGKRFREEIQKHKVSLFVVDEAHCVIFDGYNFREAYLKIPSSYKAMGFPQVLALTATATEEVRKSIKSLLKLKGCLQKVGNVSRDDLDFFFMNTENREYCIDKILEKHEGERGIIYCSTIKECNKLNNALLDQNSEVYSGVLSAENKKIFLEDFNSGNIDLAITTSSFGMGVDVDVKFVIVANLMSSVEETFQMMGRAGRHSDNSCAYLIFNLEKDLKIQKFFTNQKFPKKETVQNLYFYMRHFGEYEGDLNDLCIKFGIRDPFEAMAGFFFLRYLKHVKFKVLQNGFYSAKFIKENQTLDVVWDKVETQRQMSVKRLDNMVSLAKHKGCYHSYFSGYFGKKTKDCKKCLKNREESLTFI